MPRLVDVVFFPDGCWLPEKFPDPLTEPTCLFWPGVGCRGRGMSACTVVGCSWEMLHRAWCVVLEIWCHDVSSACLLLQWCGEVKICWRNIKNPWSPLLGGPIWMVINYAVVIMTCASVYISLKVVQRSRMSGIIWMLSVCLLWFV